MTPSRKTRRTKPPAPVRIFMRRDNRRHQVTRSMLPFVAVTHADYSVTFRIRLPVVCTGAVHVTFTGCCTTGGCDVLYLPSRCIAAIHHGDPQLVGRKGTNVLELAVLGLLHESPLHGYELRQRLKATLGTFRAFSYGSLYPSLRLMQDAGWIAGGR